ncbi:hypothetical protein B0H10DRAFT_1947888 [Mycena sp. CBHHK59/15]|nr:hypothetical protein B0H10DRAFT_1947888 [Mycena sp. CBHHK59/15]
MAERAYVKSDFIGLTRRKPYVDMIKRQFEKFPKGLNISKINIPDMQALLLDPQRGFTAVINAEEGAGTSSEFTDPSDEAQSAKDAEQFVQNTQPKVRVVQLLIQDRCTPSSEMNVAQRINLNVVDKLECQANEWRVHSVETFKQLQTSIGRLDGSGIIGVPDHQNPEYTEYFVTFNDEEGTEMFATTSSNIIIPEGNRLDLRVDHLILFAAIRYRINAPGLYLLPTPTAPFPQPAVAKLETFPAEGL